MARLDTGWHAHPKILALSVAGMAVHAWSISYCDDALTDGFIPMGAWPSKRGFSGGIKELVTAGLWLSVQGGYQLHDYTDYNRTKAQVDAYMAAKAAAGRAGGLAKSASKRVADAKADALANGLANGWQKATPGPGPGFNSRAGGPGMPGRLSPETVPESGSDPGARAREEALPDEVLERLRRPPIGDGQPARPASHSSNGFSRRRRPHAVR